MTKQASDLLAYVACIALMVTWPANRGLAADKFNYSGKYSLSEQKDKSGSEIDSALEIVQNEDNIEVTRIEQGRRMTNKYPLNGPDGEYTSPGDVSGKCKAQLKGKYLILESVVTAKPQPNGPGMRLHTKERWEISADFKTLTIKSDVDFPDAPADVSAVVGTYGSGKQKYIRNENP